MHVRNPSNRFGISDNFATRNKLELLRPRVDFATLPPSNAAVPRYGTGTEPEFIHFGQSGGAGPRCEARVKLLISVMCR
jgi:hypothetical protein